MTTPETKRFSATDRLTLFLATGGGVGRIPFAPGTWGSLLGLPLAWGTQQLPLGWRIAVAIGCFFVGVPICSRAAKLLHSSDPACVVFDEIAAFAVIFLITPINAATAVVGFALFRFFDITKLWPARKLERLPDGWGIMADDFAAGVYSTVFLWAVARWGLGS